MINAEVKYFHSPDVYDLKSWVPDDPHCFGFLLQVMAGIMDEEGADSFDFMVCTPEWLRANNNDDDVVLARHHLIVFSYDFERISTRIKELINQTGGENWSEFAEKLARHGQWEFEDYREWTGGE